MPISIFSRRGFLQSAGSAGAIPLIGTALASGAYQPTQIAALKGSAAHSVVIPTHEFAGNLDERLDFPNDWEIHVQHMKGHGASGSDAAGNCGCNQ